MRCDRARHISRLTPRRLERPRLWLHLLTCPACRAQARQARGLDRAIAGLPHFHPPAHLLPNILAAPHQTTLAQTRIKEGSNMRKLAYVGLAMLAIAIAALIVAPGGGKTSEARTILTSAAHALEDASSLYVVFRGTRSADDSPGGLQLMPGQGEIWLSDHAFYSRYLTAHGEVMFATALDPGRSLWWAYDAERRTLYQADLSPVETRVPEMISKLTAMLRASHLTEVMRQHHPDAQESVTYQTRRGRQLALVTLTYALDTRPIPAAIREVFEVDAETGLLLAMRKYAQGEGGTEELVAAVDNVDYDASLPPEWSTPVAPEGTKTVQATVTVEETETNLGLVMHANGTEVGRLDVLRDD